MKINLPWLISAGVIGIAGFIIAGYSHQSVPVDIDKSKPGQLIVEYRQTSPESGKLLSLLCAGGVAACLWIATKEDDEAIATSRPATVARVTATTAPKTRIQPPEEYDEDPVIELDEDEPIVAIAPNAQASVPKTEANLFDRMYSNHKRHLLIPAETGAGKTTLLLGAIEYGHNLFNGQIEFFGSTAKRSPCLGLEDQVAEDGQPRIIFVDPDNPSTVHDLIDRLRWLRKRLIKRGEIRTEAEQQNKPYRPKRNIVILDEWNETLETAKNYDRRYNLSVEKGKPRSDTYNELLSLANSFARTGREDEMALWLFGQDHQVQNAGINTGYRKNFAILVPAKHGSMMGLEDALTGRSPIVSSVAKGRQILAEAEAIAKANPQTGIAYSNIQGHEILVTPHLPDIKRKRLFSANAQNNVIRFPQAVGTNYVPESLEDAWADD